MATDFFKVPQTKRPVTDGQEPEMWSPAKKKKVRETFLNFCDIVLAYTQYNSLRSQEMRLDDNRSPVDSGGSTADSFNSDLAYHSEEDNNPRDHRMGSASPGNEMIADDTSFNEVSCFCGKPYMGRPMIECSVCCNWLHLSCVHLRKNNIPDTYVCDTCRTSRHHHVTTPSSGVSSSSSNGSVSGTRQKRPSAHQRAGSHHPSMRHHQHHNKGGATSAPSTPRMMTSYTPAANGVMRPSFSSASPVVNGSATNGATSSPLKSNMAASSLTSISPPSTGNTHAPAGSSSSRSSTTTTHNATPVLPSPQKRVDLKSLKASPPEQHFERFGGGVNMKHGSVRSHTYGPPERLSGNAHNYYN